jgi:hypothetical protein
MAKGSKQDRQLANKERHEQGQAVKLEAQASIGSRELDKIDQLVSESIANLRTVRDLKAISKSSTKARLTKIERHQALLVELLNDLKQNYKNNK